MQKENGRALTRDGLREAVYASCSGRLSRAEVREIIETFFEEISQALERAEPVKLQLFGSFHVRSKQARIGRNPKTGEAAPIAARKVLAFKASPVLVARINGEIIEDGHRQRRNR